jgi:hypothetical protein
MSRLVVKRNRRFSGMVSLAAVNADPKAALILEHPGRIQTTLTQMVTRHLKETSFDEFLEILAAGERVHIVTSAENYAAMKAKGDYAAAKIELVEWCAIPAERRQHLWQKMLRNQVSNAHEFVVAVR